MLGQINSLGTNPPAPKSNSVFDQALWCIDSTKIAITGHSGGGDNSLIAGALLDDKIRLAVPSCFSSQFATGDEMGSYRKALNQRALYRTNISEYIDTSDFHALLVGRRVVHMSRVGDGQDGPDTVKKQLGRRARVAFGEDDPARGDDRRHFVHYSSVKQSGHIPHVYCIGDKYAVAAPGTTGLGAQVPNAPGTGQPLADGDGVKWQLDTTPTTSTQPNLFSLINHLLNL